MKTITLNTLTLENFRSFRQRTTIALSQDAGLKFISGDNQAQPRLGANGAGKSTIWDAVVWCLYGVSVKGLRASELVSWGEKQPFVEVLFGINDDAVTVTRQGSPNRLLLNGEPVEQHDIDRLFLSRARALQCVIFGQSVPLFIDLSVPERGLLFDEVLDLNLWLKASETAGAEHRKFEQDLVAIEKDIAYLEGKQAGLPDLKDLNTKSKAWEKEQGRRIDLAIAQVEEAENEIPGLQQALQRAKVAVTKLPRSSRDQLVDTEKRKAVLEAEYRLIFSRLDEHKGIITFYKGNRTCPTCKLPVSKHFADQACLAATQRIQSLNHALTDNGFSTRRVTESINQLQNQYNTEARKREFLISQVATAQANLDNQSRIVEASVSAVETVASAQNPYARQITDVEAERRSIKQEIATAQKKRLALQEQIAMLVFWQAAFKRVRLFLVKRVLLQLEVETAAAAVALGLAKWKIVFATELETKSGTLRPGIHIQVSSPTADAAWECWSGGESQRIRLAVALGLASLIQRLAGVIYKFEVFDEPTAYLSGEGIDDLIDCLKHRVEVTGKSVWLCDHRSLSHSSFDEIWQVSKTEQGSSVALLSASEG